MSHDDQRWCSAADTGADAMKILVVALTEAQRASLLD